MFFFFFFLYVCFIFCLLVFIEISSFISMIYLPPHIHSKQTITSLMGIMSTIAGIPAFGVSYQKMLSSVKHLISTGRKNLQQCLISVQSVFSQQYANHNHPSCPTRQRTQNDTYLTLNKLCVKACISTYPSAIRSVYIVIFIPTNRLNARMSLFVTW